MKLTTARIQPQQLIDNANVFKKTLYFELFSKRKLCKFYAAKIIAECPSGSGTIGRIHLPRSAGL